MNAEQFDQFLTMMETGRPVDAARVAGLSADESQLMSATMTVLLHRNEILDPDGYVDLEKLFLIRDLILPLEERLGNLETVTEDLWRLCQAQARCIADIHAATHGMRVVETLATAETLAELRRLTDRNRPDLKIISGPRTKESDS